MQFSTLALLGAVGLVAAKPKCNPPGTNAPPSTGGGQAGAAGCDDPNNTQTISVLSGQNLTFIANEFQSGICDIAKKNGLASPDIIYAGQKLVIPVNVCHPDNTSCRKAPGTRNCTTSGPSTYKVKQGDTYFIIGQGLGLTADSLIGANPNTPPESLKPEQLINIPICPCDSKNETMTYTVQSGDTLTKISDQLQSGICDIAKLNKLASPDSIAVGQQLLVPIKLCKPDNDSCRKPAGQNTCVQGGPSNYTVKKGDTYFIIGQSLNLTADSLINANPNTPASSLQPEQVINIPVCGQGQCTSPGTVSYTVKADDTLTKIAGLYKSGICDIAKLNKIANPDLIFANQVLQVPTCVANPDNTSCRTPPGQGSCHKEGPADYTIQSGDTFFIVGQKYNITAQSLLDANPGVVPETLNVGQIIAIPGCHPTCVLTGPSRYKIKSGDTFYAVAQSFKITTEAILQANPGVEPTKLAIDQIISVPVCPYTCVQGAMDTWTVKEGETLPCIADELKVSYEALVRVNPGIDSTKITTGSVVKVPLCY